MADSDSTGPTGPAPSPEHPIIVRLDGNMPGVEFIQRLHRGGLELRTGMASEPAVIGIAGPPANPDALLPQPVSRVRRQLFEAAGIVHAVRVVLDGDQEHDDVQLASALDAAGRLIDDAAGQLEQQP